jgi:hypothetical protein
MLTLALGLALGAAALQRPHDPVVVDGALLSPLHGQAPERVVAFRYSAGWTQVPVQVDERAWVSFDAVYGPGYSLGSPLTTLAFTDAGTWTGADPDGAFDGDDELVVMAVDAGALAPAAAVLPVGVLPGSGLELRLDDPLDGSTAWVYLFASDGTLDPAAGEDRVAYTFGLLSGNYLATYGAALGPNPEDSIVITASYRTHFSDRWIRDGLEIHAGAATGVDLLDRHKFLFGPGQCARTEETFSQGEGAFFCNVDGPLRAIRSYLGANSGPITQRDHFFYAEREDVVTYMRVHPVLAAGMDLLDYSPAASGMTYSNDLNPAGVPVDGAPDVVAAGALTWERMSGPQGSLLMSGVLTTNVPGLTRTSYYSDDTTPAVTQCTGDPWEYASSGSWIPSPLPNTDPLLGAASDLTLVRTQYHEAPGASAATAALRAQQAATPLVVAVQAFAGCPSTPFAYCTAGTTASGCKALLSASGTPSVSASSGFVVSAQGVEGAKNGLFFYGFSGAQANQWGNGSSYQCVVPPFMRAGLLPGTGTSGACDGSFAQDFNAYWSGANPSKVPAVGQRVNLQLWHRNPINTSNQTSSFSDALELCAGP